jgi:hypothetical protein
MTGHFNLRYSIWCKWKIKEVVECELPAVNSIHSSRGFWLKARIAHLTSQEGEREREYNIVKEKKSAFIHACDSNLL